MKKLLRLLYISAARDGLAPQDVQDIFACCRRNNPPHELTGLLCHVGTLFFQLLEGEDERVLDLYTTIRADPRHVDCLILSLATIEKRLFERFMMGEFVRKPGAIVDYLDLAGYRRRLVGGNVVDLVRDFMSRVTPASR